MFKEEKGRIWNVLPMVLGKDSSECTCQFDIVADEAYHFCFNVTDKVAIDRLCLIAKFVGEQQIVSFEPQPVRILVEGKKVIAIGDPILDRFVSMETNEAQIETTDQIYRYHLLHS